MNCLTGCLMAVFEMVFWIVVGGIKAVWDEVLWLLHKRRRRKAGRN